MSRSPDQLAREVLIALDDTATEDLTVAQLDSARAALAELQAQAERAEAVERHNVMAAGTIALLREQRDLAEAALAAAAPSPADTEETP